MFLKTSVKLKGMDSNSILPASILDKSKMSLIITNKDEAELLKVRLSFICASVNPDSPNM